MNAGKFLLQTAVFAVLTILVLYLLRGTKIGRRVAKLPGDKLGDLFYNIDESNVDLLDSHQEGCPTLGDIITAKNNGCFSSLIPQYLWTDENMTNLTVTDAPSTCWSPDDILTENMCDLRVLELRNQIDLAWGEDMFTPLGYDPVNALLAGCYLDEELWAWMESTAITPTDNGYTLGQFGYTG